MPDEDLARAFLAGDDAAFAELFARHRDGVLAYAWRMLGSAEEAEEVCHEAWVRVVTGRWSPTGSFRSYLFTVAHRLCLDRRKRRFRAVRALSALGVRLADDRSPESAALDRERAGRLDAALARIPDDQRAALLLYYHQDLSTREVGEVLGLRDDQVRSKLAYGRRLLRAHLEEEP